MAGNRDWLVEYRSNRTQQEVADQAGITRSCYAHIEIGRRDPSIATAKKIARALGFDWTIFFTDNCGETPRKPTGTEGR